MKNKFRLIVLSVKALYAADNTCRQSFGFKPNGFEPMLCPSSQSSPTKKPTSVPTVSP